MNKSPSPDFELLLSKKLISDEEETILVRKVPAIKLPTKSQSFLDGPFRSPKER